MTCPSQSSKLYYVNARIYEVPHCEAFSTLHLRPSWAQKFVPGLCCQIPLTSVPPLMYEAMFHIHIAQHAILFFYIF